MKKKDNFKTFYALSLAWQLGFIIAVPIGGFIFLGLWGDKSFGTAPVLLIVGIFTGIIVTIYEVYHLLIPLIKDKEKKDD
jgi:F0F1-type ATP synthase assembly protein I